MDLFGSNILWQFYILSNYANQVWFTDNVLGIKGSKLPGTDIYYNNNNIYIYIVSYPKRPKALYNSTKYK